MEVDIKAYEDQIRDVIPFHIGSLKIHEGGDDFLVFEINSEWMFRFPRNTLSLKAFEKEVRFLSRLNATLPLPIPNYQYHGSNFAGYRKIMGVPLCIELFHTLSGSTRNNIAQQVGSFLSVLHNFPVKDAMDIGLTKSWEGNHHKNGQTFLEKVAPLLSSSAQRNSIRCVESLLFESFDEKVIHGDLYFPDHVFYDEIKQQLGVIDFADATIYDPAHDFQCILEIGGENFFESVMKYYRAKKDNALLKRSKMRLEARPLFYAGYIFANELEDQYASRLARIEEAFA